MPPTHKPFWQFPPWHPTGSEGMLVASLHTPPEQVPRYLQGPGSGHSTPAQGSTQVPTWQEPEHPEAGPSGLFVAVLHTPSVAEQLPGYLQGPGSGQTTLAHRSHPFTSTHVPLSGFAGDWLHFASGTPPAGEMQDPVQV